MNPTDIKYLHSGGSGNSDPLKDLGGQPSSAEIGSNELNDLTPKQSRAGRIDIYSPPDNFPGPEQPDYRCFYVKNTHSSDFLRNAVFYVDWERESGCWVDVGVVVRDEIQSVEIMGGQPPNEGDDMTLNLPTYGDFTVPYHVNITEWQGRFQTEIRGLDGCQDVIVSVAGQIGFPTDVVFKVSFIGQCGSHKLQLMSVVTNNLSDGAGMQTIDIMEIQQGSPVSVIACTIPNITTAPSCTGFDYPLRGNPVFVGDLRPGEQFPVWIRRTTPKHTRRFASDKIRFNVEGTFP